MGRKWVVAFEPYSVDLIHFPQMALLSVLCSNLRSFCIYQDLIVY